MKTSKADFKVFKESAERWLKEFGLTNWDILIVHDLVEKPSTSTAWTSLGKYGTQVGTIALCTEYTGLKVDRDNISKAGFHEVCHVLLADLCSFAECRFGVSREDYEKEVHSLITVLENTLWKRSKS